MKKETIITALVFLVVGFFIGYVTEAEFNWNAPEKIVAASPAPADAVVGAPPGTPASGSDGATLPPGHPPLDLATKIKALENQAEQSPQDPQPLLDLANLYYDQKQFDHAADWYEKALALDPKNVNAITDLGTAYYNLGRAKDALKEYEKSLKVDPTHEPTMFNIIIVNLEGTHDLAAARAAWDRLHKRNPNYPGLDDLKDKLSPGSGATSAAPSGG
ncbi:MAG TPA: tetratricopeptide repeat protein [Terriglobia bacterium]|nr:tetratricopeptide repeat protein [Terriglobia bacterium]